MADAREPTLTSGEAWSMFLQGFVPGLLQFRLGQRGRAAVALVSCLLVFFLGFALVRDRLFYYALIGAERSPGADRGTAVPGTMTRLASFGLPLTLPELLNLPGTMIGSWLSFDSSNQGERLWRLPRDLEHLGAFLTAASGMLAALFAADAFWLDKLRRRKLQAPATMTPALAAGLSWLLPGLAHARLGQRDKGLLITGCMLLVFVIGMVASEGFAVDRAQYPVWWIGQQLFGGGAMVSALLFGPRTAEYTVNGLELGIDLTTIAGFLNLVIMIDAYTIAERQGLAAAAPAPAGQP